MNEAPKPATKAYDLEVNIFVDSAFITETEHAGVFSLAALARSYGIGSAGRARASAGTVRVASVVVRVGTDRVSGDRVVTIFNAE